MSSNNKYCFIFINSSSSQYSAFNWRFHFFGFEKCQKENNCQQRLRWWTYFSKNTSIRDFYLALHQDPSRKNETTTDGKESLLMRVLTWKDVDKLSQLVHVGCVADDNIAAEKCQGFQNKVKLSFHCFFLKLPCCLPLAQSFGVQISRCPSLSLSCSSFLG